MAEPLPKQLMAEAFIQWTMDQPRGRYEMRAGEIVEMSAERNRHNLCKQEAWLALRTAVLAGKLPFTVLGDGATVIVDDHTVYEPDVTVQCGAEIDLDAVTADRPVIVVEVVSPSSRNIDVGAKLSDYFEIESIQHYLILDPEKRRAIHHARDGARIASTVLRDGTLTLDPPGITVEVADLFPRA